ncbi:MAG: ABC-type Na+ efflux pump permease component [Pseudonocardia sp.]|uniref:ABC transporter permease n=1 Tax=Pseudonocardia sp. TaxID=60912 RepID=UPI002624B287|nr:ABC transporter permease [Pseudonocardia sp.]MCU1630778.1 ABC-type Na+ efflux pump permease component [Pseudonocardia sp.]
MIRQRTLGDALTSAGQDPVLVAQRGTVAVTTLEPVDPERGQRLGLAIVTSVLLFMSLIGYGTAEAQGVVEEKSSRVVELLLATIRPIHLLTGKVLGLGAVGLAQLVTLGAVGLAGATASGLLTAPSAAASALVAAVIWYLLGFFLYASVYAAAGSMVSRQEELQSLVTPIMFPLFLPFLFAVSVLPGDPRNTVGTVLSFVPFFAPTLMPARAALGVAPWWQVGIAIVLTLATIVGVVQVAARIYRNSVLRTGARVTWSEALRGAGKT